MKRPDDCLVFLRIKGAITTPDSKEWKALTMKVTSGGYSREEVTDALRALVKDSE